MLVTLTTTTFDPLGSVELEVLDDQSDFGQTTRRVTRIATLDGGAVFNDFGHAYGDRTITLVWLITSDAQESAVERLVRLYSLLNVSLPDGVYQAAPQSYASTQTQGTLTLLVKSKLSGA